MPDDERDDIAALLDALLAGYDALFGFALPYVMGVHQAPTCQPEELAGRLHLMGGLERLASWAPVSHLHWEFAPVHRTADKIKYVAGSELMGGAYMTDVAPETAAESLRRAIG